MLPKDSWTCAVCRTVCIGPQFASKRDPGPICAPCFDDENRRPVTAEEAHQAREAIEREAERRKHEPS